MRGVIGGLVFLGNVGGFGFGDQTSFGHKIGQREPGLRGGCPVGGILLRLVLPAGHFGFGNGAASDNHQESEDDGNQLTPGQQESTFEVTCHEKTSAGPVSRALVIVAFYYNTEKGKKGRSSNRKRQKTFQK